MKDDRKNNKKNKITITKNCYYILAIAAFAIICLGAMGAAIGILSMY
jgi:hypothetical protein